MTINIVECINGVLKGARMLPITALVQLTFYRCVSYFETCRIEIRVRMSKFRRAKAKVSRHVVTIFHRINQTFEVITALHGFHMDKGRNKQVVKLNEGTCSCNKWQSFGIPCSHVLAICAHMRIDSWQFIEKYYRMDVYTVDPHFSRASPLDRRDSLFICEKLIFEKKLESPLILFLFLKGK